MPQEPRCPNCSADKFELMKLEVTNAQTPYEVIACSSCGHVLHVVDLAAVKDVRYLRADVQQIGKQLSEIEERSLNRR
jgi:uncharacterized Zn finger protein